MNKKRARQLIKQEQSDLEANRIINQAYEKCRKDIATKEEAMEALQKAANFYGDKNEVRRYHFNLGFAIGLMRQVPVKKQNPFE